MKDNRIDKLFQEKLSGLEKSPPPAAWDRVNMQLYKGKTPLLWWHKAAIVAIFCLSGTLIFSLTNRTTNKQPAVTTVKGEDHLHQNKLKGNDHSQQKTTASDIKGITNDSSINKEKNIGVVKPKTNKNIAQIAKNPTTKVYLESQSTAQEQNVKENWQQDDNLPSHLPIIKDLPAKEEVVGVVEVKKAPSVTIEFKSGRKMAEEPAVALADTPKNSSPLKKLTEKVREIKESEIDLAHIRQVKDDLLAFDSNREIFKTSDK